MSHLDVLVDELRACARKGRRLPKRADPYALYDACDGDGRLALMAAVEYEAALRLVKQEVRDRAMRERRERYELAA